MAYQVWVGALVSCASPRFVAVAPSQSRHLLKKTFCIFSKVVILFQSDVDKKSSDILKLGLLHGDMSPRKAHTGIREQPKWLEFPHKIFNDFVIAYYIAKQGHVSISKSFSLLVQS